LDDRPATQPITGRLNLVSEGYFETVHMALLQGRLPNRSDILRASAVGVVTQDLVTRYFGNQDPIGRHVQVDLFKQPIPKEILKAPQFNNSFEIVGVVGTARNRGLRGEADPAMFIPYSILCVPNGFFLVRTTSDPMRSVNQVREAVKSVDPNQAITLVRTLQGWLDTATAYPRFATFLFGVFGAVGMVLAAAGVFSVVSYGVAHRTREFGIRMALGARPGDVLRLVMVAIARVLAIGLFTGLAVSIFATHALANRMEGMGTGDLSLFALVPIVLIAATLVACLLPARAATLVHPIEALRHE
jgi:putative ABC transport system permease protein